MLRETQRNKGTKHKFHGKGTVEVEWGKTPTLRQKCRFPAILCSIIFRINYNELLISYAYCARIILG